MLFRNSTTGAEAISTPPPIFRAEATEADAGTRLDRFLADRWPALSRARTTALILAGNVALAAGEPRALSPSAKVRAGDVYEAREPPPEPAAPKPEPLDLNVVFEDESLIVVDKPAGMTVHPATGQWTGTLVNGLLAHCGDSLSGIGGVARPGIVHRIDKNTSGLLVVAKNDRAHAGLAKQFEDHSVERAYRAFVWGLPSPPADRIETLIGRDPRDRKRMAVRPSDGKRAVTRYSVVAAYGMGAAEVECRLETGRTHQIRVHLTHKGWPLIGDPVYGRATKARRALLPDAALQAARSFGRQALHAATLGFRHPISNAPLTFGASLPADLACLQQKLEKS